MVGCWTGSAFGRTVGGTWTAGGACGATQMVGCEAPSKWGGYLDAVLGTQTAAHVLMEDLVPGAEKQWSTKWHAQDHAVAPAAAMPYELAAPRALINEAFLYMIEYALAPSADYVAAAQTSLARAAAGAPLVLEAMPAGAMGWMNTAETQVYDSACALDSQARGWGQAVAGPATAADARQLWRCWAATALTVDMRGAAACSQEELPALRAFDPILKAPAKYWGDWPRRHEDRYNAWLLGAYPGPNTWDANNCESYMV